MASRKNRRAKKARGKDEIRKEWLLGALILVVVVVALFAGSLSYGFVWDDESVHFKANIQHVFRPQSWSDWLAPWKTHQGELYTPLVHTLWAFAAKIWGEPSPGLFHFVNILCHSANTVLVFHLFWRRKKILWAALFGAGIFAVHPMQVESVAWVSQFRGMSCVFFSLLAIHFYDARRMLWVLAMMLLALLCKPWAAILPVILLILSDDYRSSLRQLIPVFILGVAFSLVTMMLQPNTLINHVAPLPFRPVLVAHSLSFYLGHVIWPHPLVGSYGHSIDRLLEDPPWLDLWVIILAPVAWYLWRRERELFQGLAIFIVALIPTAGLISFTYQDWSLVADRYVYFSIFGLAWMVVCACQKWPNLRFAMVPVFCAWVVISYVRLPVWETKLGFWTDVIEKEPRQCSNAYYNRGIVLFPGELAAAQKDFEKAIEIDPRFAKAYANLGSVLTTQGELEKALAQYGMAIRLQPELSDVWVNRGKVHYMLGNHALAREDWLQARQRGHEGTEALLETIGGATP